MLSRLFRSTLRQPPAPFEALEQRSMMAADLSIAVGGLTLVQQGGTNNIKLPVTVRNVGNSPLAGGGRVEFYLSADRTLDENDFLFTTSPLPRLGRPGTSGRFTLNTPTPANLAPGVGRAIPAGEYFVIARAAPTRVNADARPANNVAATAGTVTVAYEFGRVGERVDVALNLTLPDGSVVKLALNGPGTGRVLSVNNRLVVVVDGTNHNSTLSLTPLAGSPTLNGLTINRTIADIVGPGVNIDGDIRINGAVGNVVLGDVRNSQFTVTGFGTDWAARLGHVENVSITSGSLPLRGLHVSSWTESNATRDTISAPYIGTLSSSGNFHASPNIPFANKGLSIEAVRIEGDLSRGVWTIAGSIDTLNVRNITQDWSANIRGEVGLFSVAGNLSGTIAMVGSRRFIVGGAIRDAQLLFGVDLGSDARLGGTGSAADIFNAGRIGTFEVRRGGITNSVVAAGLRTTDAVLLDADDSVIAGGFINAINVRGGLNNSKFVGATLPSRARVNGRLTATANNPNFIRSLP